MLISILFDVLSIGSIIPLINYFILDIIIILIFFQQMIISKLDEKETSNTFSAIIIYIYIYSQKFIFNFYTKISSSLSF